MNPRLLSAIAASLVFAASAATASDAPTQCMTNGGGWIVSVTAPFDAANCPGGGTCTGLTYMITPLRGEIPDHVALLAQHDTDIVVPSSNFVSPPCTGDSVTLLGTRDCSTQAVRLNQNQQKVGPFDLIVHDTLKPVGASIVVKKGKVIEQCRIASLGRPYEVFDPKEQVPVSQTYDFEGCQVTIPTNVDSGEGGTATISGSGCVFVANGLPVGVAKLIVDGKDVGFATHGLGAVSTGSDSCTTRVISNRLYTWCTCTDANGDGITEDPRPPCP
jgi:hypothetical protein